jgi:cytochrome c oxidase assembly protein subunit 15
MASAPTSLAIESPVRSGPLRSPQAAARFAWAVVAYNVLVVLWGALVRATGSGAGCGNHWPLCNGVVVPVSPTFHTIVEFTHRMMVSGSVFAMIALLLFTWRASSRGWAARVFATLSGILLINEAFLGALLVKLGYVTNNYSLGRVVVLSVHLGNTLLLLAAITLTAVMLGTQQRWRDLHAHGRDLSIASVGLLATLIVGISGSLAALGDTLFPSSSFSVAMAKDFAASSPLLIRLRGVHPASAFVAAAFVFWLVVRSRRQANNKTGNVVLALLALQFVLGVSDVLLLAPTWMQIVHLLGADIFWLALVVAAARTVWPLDPAFTSSSAVPAQ